MEDPEEYEDDLGYENEEEPSYEESEEVEETEEEEEETSEMPEYYSIFGQEFVPPHFDDLESEIEWYRDTYPKIAQHYQSDEFAGQIKDAYSNILMEKEEEIEQLKATSKAINGDPTMFIKMYYPKMAAENGIDPRMSKKDANTYVNSILVQEFGLDFENQYDRDEAYDPKSFSGQVAKRHRDLISEVHSHNEQAEALIAQFTPKTEEQTRANLDKQYEQHMKQYMSKEEYNAFIKEADNVTYNVQDIYHMMHFDGFMNQVYEEGIKAGRRTANKEISKQGNKAIPRQTVERQPINNGKPITAWDLYK